ncbi:hypothetical protein [Hazenella coriacea]|uniref:Uncharacterized protein n=1 Tax=Hazenella coriacea TaxID=1179467 RepID=A0A4R3L1D1_9BACL|nr:hypothetical protein [Hazenella coriacea]TCS92079.1 hypothetical protein EDD58_1186 [Hazenella coriacea]
MEQDLPIISILVFAVLHTIFTFVIGLKLKKMKPSKRKKIIIAFDVIMIFIFMVLFFNDMLI